MRKIKAAWRAIVDRLKRLFKRDAPHLRYGVGGKVYVNGVPYVVVGMMVNVGRSVQVELEPWHIHQAKVMYSPHLVDPRILKEDLR